MAETLPRITVRLEAEAPGARAEVGSVRTPANGVERTQLDLVHQTNQQEQNDYWITREGRTFAGVHLIIDMWDARNLDDEACVRRALTKAAKEAGATLLHIHTHKFNQGGGISGVAVLAESHISVHTWPERRFAAFDVFMCGCARPADALPALERAFTPARMKVVEHERGFLD